MTNKIYEELKKIAERFEKDVIITEIGNNRNRYAYSAYSAYYKTTKYYKATNKNTGTTFFGGDDMGRVDFPSKAFRLYLKEKARDDLTKFDLIDIRCYEEGMAEIIKGLKTFAEDYNKIINNHDSFIYVDKNTYKTVQAEDAPKIKITDDMFSWKNISNLLELGDEDDFGAMAEKNDKYNYGDPLEIDPSWYKEWEINKATNKAIEILFSDAKDFLSHVNFEELTRYSIRTLKDLKIIPEEFTNDPYGVKFTLRHEEVFLPHDGEDGEYEINKNGTFCLKVPLIYVTIKEKQKFSFYAGEMDVFTESEKTLLEAIGSKLNKYDNP